MKPPLPYLQANATLPDCAATTIVPLPALRVTFWAIAFMSALAVFFILVFTSLALLGRGKFYRAQAFIANLLVVLPANVVLVSAFILGTPVRLVYNRCMNRAMTAIVSIGTSRPTFWQADYNTLLKAFPVGYRAILGGHDPMTMDFGACADVMREKMQQPSHALSAAMHRFVLLKMLRTRCSQLVRVAAFYERDGAPTIVVVVDWFCVCALGRRGQHAGQSCGCGGSAGSAASDEGTSDGAVHR